MERLGRLLQRVQENRFVAHLLRGFQRYGDRLGGQFAAAITYFSVLAMVPIVMFAFSMLGMTLTVLRPDLLENLASTVADQLGSAQGSEQVMQVVENALENWRVIGFTAVAAAAYAGAGWVGNLRRAVDAMWRPAFDITPPGSGPFGVVVEVMKNLGVLLGLVVFGALSLAASSAANGLLAMVLGLFGLSVGAGIGPGVVFFAGVVASLITGWLLFAYLYSVLPTERRRFAEVAQGAIFGAVGLTLLQFFAGRITGIFAGNAAAALFGPVIVLMLAFNLFASIVLLGAAWTATAIAGDAEPLAAADGGEPDAVLLGPAAMAEIQGPRMVPQKVAQQGVRVGMGLGYLSGAATGIGLGAVVGRVLAGIVYRHRRRRGW